MNEMHEYLQEHAYISENKKSNYQFELSKERAECIANKYNSLVGELKKQNEFLMKRDNKCQMLEQVIDKIRKELSEEYSIMGVKVVEKDTLEDILKEAE